jgi:hypothetical protein
MNILTLVGLLMTGLGLTLRRMGRAGLPLCLGVMSVGMVLVLGWAVCERVSALAVASLEVVKNPLNPNNNL